MRSCRPARATAWYPASWSCANVELEVRDSAVHLLISVPHGEATVRLWKLFTRRFEASRVRGKNVRVWFRPERSLFSHARDLEPPISPPHKPPSRPTPPGELWGVKLDDVLVHTRDVWIEQLRVRGPLSASGSFNLQPLQSVRIDDAHVASRRARLTIGKQSVADGLAVDGRVSLERQDLRAAKSVLPALVVALRLEGGFSPAPFAQLPGKGGPGLRGDGFIEAEVGVDHAALAKGSRLGFVASDLAGKWARFKASGGLALQLVRHRGDLELAAFVEQAQVESQRGRVVRLDHARLDLRTSPRIRAMALEALEIDATNLEVPEVHRLRDKLGALSSARGRVGVDLAGRYSGGRADGEAVVHLDGLEWRHSDFLVRADGLLRARAQSRPPFKTVELDDVNVSLDHARIRRKDSSSRDFAVHLASDKVLLSTQRLRVSGRVQLGWPDGDALQAAAAIDKPPIVGGLFDLSDLEATVDVRPTRARTRRAPGTCQDAQPGDIRTLAAVWAEYQRCAARPARHPLFWDLAPPRRRRRDAGSGSRLAGQSA